MRLKLPRVIQTKTPNPEAVAVTGSQQRTQSVDTVDPVMRPKAVLSTLGVSRATLYRLVAAGRLPRPIHVSTNVTGWRASQINRFLDELSSGHNVEASDVETSTEQRAKDGADAPRAARRVRSKR